MVNMSGLTLCVFVCGTIHIDMPTLSDEDKDSLNHFDWILEEADGIILSRGNLGIDLPPEKVFLFQKSALHKCNMAEATDVANAVLDDEVSKFVLRISETDMLPAKAPTTAKKIEESNESSDSESSDSEKPATEVKNYAVATTQKKNQELDGSDSDSDDSSDEDMATKKPVAKKVVESSESSDSDSEEDTTAKPVQSSKAIAVKKNKESSDSSNFDSDSDSEEVLGCTCLLLQIFFLCHLSYFLCPGYTTAKTVNAKKLESSGSSDKDLDLDSDEPAKSTIPAKRPLTTEKKSEHYLQSKDDSDDSSDESDEEPALKKPKVERQDEVEAARMAAINKEIKRVLTEVLLKVSDDLFNEITAKVMNEDDSSAGPNEITGVSSSKELGLGESEVKTTTVLVVLMILG
ncbi:Pyruvate kinase [Triticum urartu]|uniref:Pyruvate kinase n=1 Tax=Triticum urartu TaxID=4572 RepID=M7Z3C3_TRIUA|nr:Pyruvate kinase [Triticum urartu]